MPKKYRSRETIPTHSYMDVGNKEDKATTPWKNSKKGQPFPVDDMPYSDEFMDEFITEKHRQPDVQPDGHQITWQRSSLGEFKDDRHQTKDRLQAFCNSCSIAQSIKKLPEAKPSLKNICKSCSVDTLNGTLLYMTNWQPTKELQRCEDCVPDIDTCRRCISGIPGTIENRPPSSVPLDGHSHGPSSPLTTEGPEPPLQAIPISEIPIQRGFSIEPCLNGNSDRACVDCRFVYNKGKNECRTCDNEHSKWDVKHGCHDCLLDSIGSDECMACIPTYDSRGLSGWISKESSLANFKVPY